MSPYDLPALFVSPCFPLWPCGARSLSSQLSIIHRHHHHGDSLRGAGNGPSCHLHHFITKHTFLHISIKIFITTIHCHVGSYWGMRKETGTENTNKYAFHIISLYFYAVWKP